MCELDDEFANYLYNFDLLPIVYTINNNLSWAEIIKRRSISIKVCLETSPLGG